VRKVGLVRLDSRRDISELHQIDAKHQQRVFGLFERLDSSVEGTGIGLALVKRIVEVHGGQVWVESAGRGQGTTVCVSLPQRPAQSAPPLPLTSDKTQA